jgi:hypothetical protein
MEDINAKVPLFKKLDRALFAQIDKFKSTPNYNLIQDFYNSLEEEQQKLFKAIVILCLFLIPSMGMGFIYWQNGKLTEDLNLRKSIIAKANEIIGQSQGIRDVSPQIISQSPIDSSSMMTSRLSNLLTGGGVDLSKIQVGEFASDPITGAVMKSEATFSFNNFSTDELMNTFTVMIQREKFRIQSVNINRNSETELLQGNFHAIHYSAVSQNAEPE